MFRVRVTLDRKQIGFLRFLLEGYEGLATTTTIDRQASIVELQVLTERAPELWSLLTTLRQQLGISGID